jgi:hypothetical protein
MTTGHKFAFAFALGLAMAGGSGCQRNIVRAEPPSVTSPPTVEPLPAPEPAPTVAETAPPAPVPEPAAAQPPAVDLAPEPLPPKPRPAPAEAEAAKPKTDAPAPEIAPQLSPQQQAAATRSTTEDIRVAEKNLQAATGKPLNAAQKDLYEKVQGFLSQAHDAIRANDWVRAQNIAHKAQVLSVELTHSF